MTCKIERFASGDSEIPCCASPARSRPNASGTIEELIGEECQSAILDLYRSDAR